MPPISMFDDDLGPLDQDDFLGLFQPHDSQPKAIGNPLLQPGQPSTLPSAISPNASDQDSASDSSPSPNTMNTADEDFDMFSYNTNQSGDWAPFDNFTNFGDAPQMESNTINPSLIQGDFNNASFMEPLQSSSPSESNSSNGMINDSDESPPTDTMDAILDMGFSKGGVNGLNGLNAMNGVAKPMRSPVSQSRKKRHSVRQSPVNFGPFSHLAPGIQASANVEQQQASVSKSVNGLSVDGSRETSPMSNMILSQGSSPLASHEMSVPDSRSMPQRRQPQNSWFNVDPGQNQWPNGQLSQATFQGAPSAFAPVMQSGLMAAQKSRYTLAILDMPRKSRVETQIHLKMSLHPVPQGITKIRLPRHTISKPKFLAKPRPDRRPDTLELSTQLVCSSAMSKPGLEQKARARAANPGSAQKRGAAADDKAEDGGEVRICPGCITREQKRANRKKNNRPGEDDEWKSHETERVIVFNTNEVKELKTPEYTTNPGTMLIDIPMRIACYCRHHHEKLGFKIIFTLKDHNGQVVAQELSPSIMITDDHKTPQTNPNSVGGIDQADSVAVASANDLNSIPPGLPFRQSQSTSDLQALQLQAMKRSASDLAMAAANSGASSGANSATATPNMSRPPSPGAIGPSAAKKRKSSSSKVPTTLTMTRLETPTYAPPPSNHMSHGMPGSSSATSPFSPPSSIAFSDASAPAFGQGSTNAMFQGRSRTPNGNEQNPFQSDANRTPNAETMGIPPLYSGPASSQNSRAASPNSVMNGVLQQQRKEYFQFRELFHAHSSEVDLSSIHPRVIESRVLPQTLLLDTRNSFSYPCHSIFPL